jgi:hypothetical protein
MTRPAISATERRAFIPRSATSPTPVVFRGASEASEPRIHFSGVSADKS